MRHFFALAAILLLASPGALLAGPRPMAEPDPGPEHARWTLLAGPVDPPAMSGHAAIRDPARHRMVVINGQDPREVWELSLPEAGAPRWSRRAVAGPNYPEARTVFAAVLDSARDRVILFGGRQGIRSCGDVWTLSLGDAPKWTRLEPGGVLPPPRDQVAAVFDPVRDRVLFFGGVSNADYQDEVLFDDTWVLELGGTPTWRRLWPAGGPPSRRKGASAVYDPWGDRMIVFGGWEPYNLPPPIFSESRRPCNDTWALSLSGVPVWEKLETISPPLARQEHAALVDPVGRRMIVTGGNSAQWAHTLNDTWALPLEPGVIPAWSRLTTSGAVPSEDRHAAVYSSERSSLVQYGGEGGGNGTYELSLATDVWTQIQSDAPAQFPRRRTLPTLLADPGRGQLLLFGGGWGCQHDLWSFPASGPPEWSLLPTAGIAPVCLSPHFVHDAARHRLLAFFGGYVAPRGQTLDQVWAMSLEEPRVWTRLEVTGPFPPGRDRYGLVYDPVRDRVLLFGGASYFTRVDSYGYDRDDLWALSLADLKWTELHTSNSPGARRDPWTEYDPKLDRMLVVGGNGGYPRASWTVPSCWSLPLGGDSLRWAPLGPDVPVVQPAALDPLRNRLVLWNGAGAAWTLPLDDPQAWAPLQLEGDAPVARNYSGSTYDPSRDRLVIFGGDGGLQKADLWELRFSDEVVVDLRPRGPDGLLPLRSHGTIEAVVLGARTFAVDSVLVSTVTLAGAHAIAGPHGPAGHEVRDVDGDRFADLVLKFPVDSMQVKPEDSVIPLLGRTPNFGIRALVPVRTLPGRSRPVRSLDAPESAAGLRLTVTTPVTSALELRCTLASPAEARIEVFDVAGRRVLAHRLQGLGPGPHELRFERGSLPPGLYLVRLQQGAQAVTARAIALR